jgi:hypothetical protein
MLLFELFPAFVALVSIVVGIWLFMQNLDADNDPEQRKHTDTSSAKAVDSTRSSFNSIDGVR